MKLAGRRILFRWRGRPIHSYPVMLYLGLVTGVAAGNVAAHRAAVDPLRVFVATLLLIPCALLGARLLYVLTHLRRYRVQGAGVWEFRQGGADMFGGFPVVLLVSAALLPRLGLTFWRYWDVAVVTIFSGMLVARFGCYFNGCCAGRPSKGPWALQLPNHRGVVRRRIPMQLWEAGWVALVLLFAVSLLGRLPVSGALFCLTSAAYCLGRFLLDPFREECRRGLGPFSLHQLIYGATFACCLVVAWCRWTVL